MEICCTKSRELYRWSHFCYEVQQSNRRVHKVQFVRHPLKQVGGELHTLPRAEWVGCIEIVELGGVCWGEQLRLCDDKAASPVNRWQTVRKNSVPRRDLNPGQSSFTVFVTIAAWRWSSGKTRCREKPFCVKEGGYLLRRGRMCMQMVDEVNYLTIQIVPYNTSDMLASIHRLFLFLCCCFTSSFTLWRTVN